MATYFQRYYLQFTDRHRSTPATWRVDILDSEGVVPTEPYRLTASANPLMMERIETSEDKSASIIGRQITIKYEYTGNLNEPLPDVFFDSDERRFRVEVRKNGALDGVYYIRPDYSQYTLKHAPITVELKAVDGFSYAKGQPFNIYEDGLLHYTHIPLYEAIMTRALCQVLDPDTPINVINSLLPGNIGPGDRLLHDISVHTDAFYDFVEGASTIHDVLVAFCKAFYARIFIARNQVWFIRNQDLDASSFTAEQYIDDNTVNDVAMPDFIADAGAALSYDAMPIDNEPTIRQVPAIKKAKFETNYKAINLISNFDWRHFSSGTFDDWNNQSPVIVSRTGSGTMENPWKAFINYDTGAVVNINQPIGGAGATPVQPGDIIEISFNYKFHNTSGFAIYVSLVNAGQPVAMAPGGEWVYVGGEVNFGNRIVIKRSGKKRNGSFSVKSLPIPKTIKEGVLNDNIGISILIFAPFELYTDGEPVDGIEIYPIKLGIISFSSEGRQLNTTSAGRFSYERPDDTFTFIDTGEDGVSNTLFTDSPLVPCAGWSSGKPGTITDDIERQMARAHIDQYARSIKTWEGALYSNSLEFYQVLEYSSLPGRRFMQMSDRYDVETCTHECLVMEVLPEGNATVTINEYDIEDEIDD